MPASYPTTAKTFTTKSNNTTADASHINDVQAEITAIETDLIAGLPVARGGTGNTTLTANRVLLGNGTSAVAVVAAGTASQVLTSNGSSAPTWTDRSRVSALSDGATVALDAALGDVFTLTAGGNRTILTPTNATAGQKLVIAHTASGADRTLSLTTGSAGAFRFGSDIAALTATVSGKTDYIGCIYNGTDSRFDVVAYVKGY